MKYIAEILEKISSTQRITALTILLLTLTVIYLGPKLIQSLSLSREGYEERIIELEDRISVLGSEVRESSEDIREERMRCTSLILEREQEFILQLDRLMDLVLISRESKRFSNKMYSPRTVDTIPPFITPPVPQVPVFDTDIENIILNELKSIRMGLERDSLVLD